MAMQASSAMFRNANNPGREIEFTIGFDDHYTVVSTGPNSAANAGKWLAAMYFAAICRRHDRMTELCQTSIETLRASGAVYDEYIYTWVAAFQKFWRNDEDGVVQSLIDAMNAAEPEDLVHASEELLLLLLYPPIELLCIAAQGDAVWFNERLAVALERHKQYWSKTAERRNDVEGFIAWGPLAMACLALDMGLSITVESDYMPVHLLLSERAAEANMIRDDQRRAQQRGRQ
ncbi:MAG: immunity 49 family protein [Mycolicibacterium sp.]|nr:immunity 49 family protein [Mycolicibacterium sp.]